MANVTRGHRRFARGMNTIRNNPTHAGAKVWLERLDRAFGHDFNSLRLRKYADGFEYNYDTTRYKYTCSDFCAVIAQDLLVNYANRNDPHGIDVSLMSHNALKRAVTCFACGRRVNPDGTLDVSQRVDFTVNQSEPTVEPEPAAQLIDKWESILLEQPGVGRLQPRLWVDTATGTIHHVEPKLTPVFMTEEELVAFNYMTVESMVAFLTEVHGIKF